MIDDGVFSVLPTPFGGDGAVDLRSLRKVTRFFADAGVDGLVALGVTSEVTRLTDREQVEVLECVLEEVGGRLPVIAGTTSDGLATTIELSRRARTLGAAGVMIAPPRMGRPTSEAIVRYFEALGDAIDAEIVLQDYPAVSGFAMEVALLARLANEIPAIRAIKLEDPPTAPKIAALRSAMPGNHVPVTIFGGLGGAFLLEELLAGSSGAMTGFAFPEVLVAVVRAFRSSGAPAAADIFYRYLPVIRLEAQEGIGLALRKEFLRRRGAIARADLRAPAGKIDLPTQDAIAAALAWTSLVNEKSEQHPWN